ncbi:MAG: 16S rRNA (cytosine(1402)-N(4))-methyltransferase RsmH [Elusimicrobia bacterium]|nr:16S rRNA (cytosine(1402)-N(4))-methyltransferase RsmH [Elusimicrobiota bacterium]
MISHIPVMLNEVVEYLNIKENGTYVDCTFGSGGHSLEIAKKLSGKGKLFCIDWDIDVIESTGSKFEEYKNVKIINENFANLEAIVKKNKIKKVNGILFDLGFSSVQIENVGKGFSFNYDAPLDMRFNKDNALTAGEILNNYPEGELISILNDFSDEQFAENIVKEICLFRKTKKIETTKELVDIIRRATPSWYKHRRIHFATKTFQAIRIAVNNELENIKAGLSAALKVSASGGRIVVISFHSIEHRLLKKAFIAAEKSNLIILTEKKPIFPKYEEILNNPRARSAQMRVVEKR